MTWPVRDDWDRAYWEDVRAEERDRLNDRDDEPHPTTTEAERD